MEYQRQFDKIQAGYALHAAKLLWQYETLTKQSGRMSTDDDEPRYEGTLTVCVLQALLTQCSELMAFLATQQRPKEFFDHDLRIKPHPWGLREAFVTKDTFPVPLTLGRLLTHMRNAVSHPSFLEPRDSDYDPTGFTTINSVPGAPIQAYRFTDSPWVKNGKRDYKGRLPVKTERGVRGKAKLFHKEWEVEDYLDTFRTPDGRFDLSWSGDLYWPIFQIDLPLLQLRRMAVELANYLANKSRSDWDGGEVHRFVPPLAA